MSSCVRKHLRSVNGTDDLPVRVSNVLRESYLLFEFVKCSNCVSGAGQIEFEVLFWIWLYSFNLDRPVLLLCLCAASAVLLCYDVAFLGFGYLTHRQMTFS